MTSWQGEHIRRPRDTHGMLLSRTDALMFKSLRLDLRRDVTTTWIIRLCQDSPPCVQQQEMGVGPASSPCEKLLAPASQPPPPPQGGCRTGLPKIAYFYRGASSLASQRMRNSTRETESASFGRASWRSTVCPPCCHPSEHQWTVPRVPCVHTFSTYLGGNCSPSTTCKQVVC